MSFESFKSELEMQGHVDVAEYETRAAKAGTSLQAVYAEMSRLNVKVPWQLIGKFLACVFVQVLTTSLPEAILTCAKGGKPNPINKPE